MLFSYDHTYYPPGTTGYFGIHSVLSWWQICWNRSGQPNVLLFVYVETLSALHHPTSSSPAEDNGARENDRANEGNNYTLQDLSSTLRFDEHFHRRHRFWSSQRPSAQAGLAIFIFSQQRTLKSREVRTRAKIHTECHWANQSSISNGDALVSLDWYPIYQRAWEEGSILPFLPNFSILFFLLFFPARFQHIAICKKGKE